MNKFLILIYLVSTVYSFGQEPNDNCSEAILLCDGVTISSNNTDATAQTCAGCEDEYTLCITPVNTVWFKFITNSTGGTVDIQLTNLIYTIEAGRSDGVEIAVYSYTTDCIPSTYTSVSSCNFSNSAGATVFGETVTSLAPNTEYYIVINGYNFGAGITLPGEASFDITISGAALVRPTPSIAISSSSINICKGDLLTFSTIKTDCVFDSTYTWTVNGVDVATSSANTYQSNTIQDLDYVGVYTICDTICQIATVMDSIQINVLDLVVNAGNDVEIIEGASTPLNGSGQGQVILWVPGSSLSNPNVINPVASPTQTTTYFLTITDTVFGCTGYDSVTVNVIENLKIPDAFTPNNDGINDTWEILTIEDYPDCEIIIYDRWGQSVFKTISYPPSKWWDGKSKGGNDLSPGTYFYYIDLKSSAYPDPFRGSINLIR